MRKAAPIIPHTQLIVFRLGADQFGVEILAVREVLPYEPVTSMPDAPEFVEGVLSVRGSVIPVVDLRRRFELPDPQFDRGTRMLLIDLPPTRLAIVVDEVLEVRKVPEADITEPPPFLRGISAEYISGVARTEDGLIVVLDLERVLTSEERIALEETEAFSGTPRSAGE